MCLLIFITSHNCFMCIFSNEPFFRRKSALTFISNKSTFSCVINHCTSIFDICYQLEYFPMSPLSLRLDSLTNYGFLLCRSRNIFGIQLFCYLCARLSCDYIHENTSNNHCRVWLNNQMTSTLPLPTKLLMVTLQTQLLRLLLPLTLRSCSSRATLLYSLSTRPMTTR